MQTSRGNFAEEAEHSSSNNGVLQPGVDPLPDSITDSGTSTTSEAVSNTSARSALRLRLDTACLQRRIDSAKATASGTPPSNGLISRKENSGLIKMLPPIPSLLTGHPVNLVTGVAQSHGPSPLLVGTLQSNLVRRSISRRNSGSYFAPKLNSGPRLSSASALMVAAGPPAPVFWAPRLLQQVPLSPVKGSGNGSTSGSTLVATASDTFKPQVVPRGFAAQAVSRALHPLPPKPYSMVHRPKKPKVKTKSVSGVDNMPLPAKATTEKVRAFGSTGETVEAPEMQVPAKVTAKASATTKENEGVASTPTVSTPATTAPSTLETIVTTKVDATSTTSTEPLSPTSTNRISLSAAAPAFVPGQTVVAPVVVQPAPRPFVVHRDVRPVLPLPPIHAPVPVVAVAQRPLPARLLGLGPPPRVQAPVPQSIYTVQPPKLIPRALPVAQTPLSVVNPNMAYNFTSSRIPLPINTAVGKNPHKIYTADNNTNLPKPRVHTFEKPDWARASASPVQASMAMTGPPLRSPVSPALACLPPLARPQARVQVQVGGETWNVHTTARPNWALAPEERKMFVNENERPGGFVVPPLQRGPPKWRGKVGGRFGG